MAKISVIIGRLAAKGARAAVQRGKKASKHYCPVTDGRHHMTSHKNTDLPEEGHRGGPVHGVTHIMYCRDCGWTGHRR